MPEVKAQAARGARSPERSRVRRRPLLLPASAGIRARSIGCKALLKDDPEYTGRDAVYFYLGESLLKVERQAEALPYFEKLVAEFEQSEYLEDARKRIVELEDATGDGRRRRPSRRRLTLSGLAVDCARDRDVGDAAG